MKDPLSTDQQLDRCRIDPYHNEVEWLKLPVRERLARRIIGTSLVNVRGCITQDLKDAIRALDEKQWRCKARTAPGGIEQDCIYPDCDCEPDKTIPRKPKVTLRATFSPGAIVCRKPKVEGEL